MGSGGILPLIWVASCYFEGQHGRLPCGAGPAMGRRRGNHARAAVPVVFDLVGKFRGGE